MSISKNRPTCVLNFRIGLIHVANRPTPVRKIQIFIVFRRQTTNFLYHRCVLYNRDMQYIANEG